MDDTSGDRKHADEADEAELRLTRELQRMAGCSRLLERVLTDFGADLPYARAMDKVVERACQLVAVAQRDGQRFGVFFQGN